MTRTVIPEGTEAPSFELPAWVDGERRRLALAEYVGEDVVILAFYPADFNPACDAESDLDELDLFTMQKDVSVLAVGPDTLYSHAAFADEYDLHVPLLSDGRREVAESYGVAFEDDVGQPLVERAVVVIDHDGVVQYTWSTREMASLPPVDEIKDAIADTGGDDTAFARYQVGFAHYTEGRRAFTSAMHSFGDSDWMIAQSDFKRAREEFEEAADHFDSAVRFVDDPDLEAFYDEAQEKATALWQAADWLSQSASEYSSGRGAEAQRLRDDAERPLENARGLRDPVDPDEWPPSPEEDVAEGEEDDVTFVPQDDAERESALGVDIDEGATAEGDGDRERDDGTADDADGEDTIDDAELEEIEAELAASQPDNPEGEELAESPTSMVDAPPDARDDGDGPAADDGGGSAADRNGTDGDRDGDRGSADIDGEVGEADLEALEADMAASQSAVEQADGEAGPGDGDDNDAGGDGTAGDQPGPDAGSDRTGDAPAGEDPDETDRHSGQDDEPGDPPADPHADLAEGAGDVPPDVSGSLESVGEGDATDGDADEPDLSEPEGASDDDLADIPTADELATAGEEQTNGGDDGDDSATADEGN